MDELIKQLTAKTGISEDQARSAVTTVLDFVKGKLPAALASQVDNAVSGSGGGANDMAGDIASKVGGLFS
jgi:uncharacterized protein (DUF2267 family)